MRIVSLLILICLITVFQKIKSPHGSDFKVSCSVCHSTKGWHLDREIYSFNHDTTSFPLTGQHSVTDCRSCHKSLTFSEAPSACFACHADVHQQTVGNECDRCHNTGSWLVSDIISIHRNSRFPLLGAHRTADCIMCHKSENPVKIDVLGIECIDCHRNDYYSATNPNHVLSNYSQACSQCHDLNSYQWQGAGFNHDFFPLTNGHASITCAKCHSNKPYQSSSPECSSCHLEDYNSSTNPAHRSQNFPLNCTECHTTNPGWKPASFDHTSFPLTKGHSSVTCTSCHKTNNYSDTKPECSACHLQDYNSATNPSHSTQKFPLTCTECHTTNAGWKPATFNHSFFPLTLGHSSQTCASCHKTNNYSDAKAECSACHLQDYNSTTNPSHTSQNFPLTCTECHTTNPGWKPATFNHSFFPLTLGHSSLTCASCHKTNNYADAKPECSACHLQDYNGTTNPSHSSQNFPLTCTECHTTNPGWTPATFNHSFFPLTLGHSSLTCASCHKTNNYADAKPDCSLCHLQDYNNTTNPVHKNLNFSLSCPECHTTNPDWKPARYTLHDSQSFPIYSGRHLNQWSSCTDCHNQPSNYSIFTCTSCHEHSSKSNVDGHHSGVRDYVYSPTSCYTCHRTGSAG